MPNSVFSSSLLATSIASLLCTLPPKALGWGAVAHEVINEAALQGVESEEKDFLLANADSLVNFATVPDRLWKGNDSYAEEGPLHYFDWDNYDSSPLGEKMPVSLQQARDELGDDFIQKNGAGIWRVEQIYSLLVAAIKAGDCPKILQMAGVLGHYVGDMSNPMHFTSDYDGGSINRPGIHADFETNLVNSIDRETLLEDVKGAMSAELSRNSSAQVTKTAFEEGKEALEQLPGILAIYKRKRDEEALKKYLPPLMALGASTFASLLDQASTEARSSSGCPATSINVAEPRRVKFP